MRVVVCCSYVHKQWILPYCATRKGNGLQVPKYGIEYGSHRWLASPALLPRYNNFNSFPCHLRRRQPMPPQRQQSRTVFSSSAVQSLLDTSLQRHEEILTVMKGSGHTPAPIVQELSFLSTIVDLVSKRTHLLEDSASYKSLQQEAQESQDKELELECSTELARIAKQQSNIEAIIVNAFLPQNQKELESDAILEIRAGTGGEEAALFAADLWHCYIKTAQALRWKVDILTASHTDLGGIKEGSFVVMSGGTLTANPKQQHDEDSDDDENDVSSPILGPFGFFQFESGVHRVQRVPVNDTRIHTSACSIAVMPSVSSNNAAELLPMSELKIETMRAQGAGGQHINTTDSAVRITHIPTGIQAAIQDERSQHKNKAKALALVTARVLSARLEQEASERGAARSSLMGGGDRSERIRTFNFPQDRVTDHRCKESKQGITVLLGGSKEDGLVASFLPFLRSMRREELLIQLEAGTGS